MRYYIGVSRPALIRLMVCVWCGVCVVWCGVGAYVCVCVLLCDGRSCIELSDNNRKSLEITLVFNGVSRPKNALFWNKVIQAQIT